MKNFQVDQINAYTASVRVDGTNFIIRDPVRQQRIERQQVREELRRKQRKLGNFIYSAAVIIGMAAAFYILGIVGHSDFCVEFHVEDEWSLWDYFIRIVIASMTIWGCTWLSKYGIALRGYYYGKHEKED